MVEQLEHGISCIDTGYLQPGTACCYVMLDHGEAAIIETGTALGVPRILQTLEHLHIAPQQLRYVIPTHVHLDHAGGAGALLQALPDATLLVHPRGARHLIDPARLIEGATAVYGAQRFAELYGEVVPALAARVQIADDGSRWTLGQRQLLMRDTPGHARHHFCVWDELSRGWFSGDTFGIAYRELYCAGEPFLMPTTTPVQFEPEALLASLDLLMAQQPDFMYLTHFGRIRASEAGAAALREQIADYVRIANHHACDDATGLRAALADYTVARLQRAGCRWPEARMRRFLDFDMGLNTQGLLHWRQHG